MGIPLRLLLVALLGAVSHAQSSRLAPEAVTAPATCSSAEDARALAQISELWKEGYNSGHADRVAALYAEDAYYLTQHFVTGIVHGRDAIQAYFENGVSAKYHMDSIEVVHSECADDFAYTVTRYESTNAGQKAFGVNVVVLRKIGGRWLIVAHESAVPDRATAIQKLDIPSQR